MVKIEFTEEELETAERLARQELNTIREYKEYTRSDRWDKQLERIEALVSVLECRGKRG